jgi:beta-lactamase regulating signal transducer with metallopeptidase domain
MLLPDVSTAAVPGLGRAAWQGSLGLVVVWLICGLVPRVPARFQCWLWRLALLKFVVVLLWGAPLAVPLLPAVAEPPSHVAMPPGIAPGVGVAVPIPPAGNVAGPPTIDPLTLLLTILFLAWLVAVAWQAIRLIRGWMAMRRFRHRCRPLCSDELTRHLGTLCKAYGVRRPPLLLAHEGCGSPLLLGMLHPAIVLPSALRGAFGAEQYRMALAHELAHIKRRDLAWSLAAALVRMVFVFHPLVWWGSRRLDVSQEIAADQFVLTGSGKDLSAYAEMLLAVANQPQPGGMVPALSVGTVGRYQTLKRRITAMKSFHPTSRGVMAASVILVFLVAAVGVVPWRLVAADAPPPAVESSTDRAGPAETHTAHVGMATAKSVTIFPIVLNAGAPMPGVSRDMPKSMAELIGLMLERGGMKDVEIADAKFIPAEKADLAKAAEAFGQFVKSQKITTAYACLPMKNDLR